MLHGERRLKFNICNLSTSFLPNSLVPELPALVQKKVGEALSYACHFWTSHYAKGPGGPASAVEKIRTLLSTDQLFHWLEVLSITGVSPLESLSLISGQVSCLTTDRQTSELVTEAVHFTSYYAIPIAQSAPHIYLSAILFIPTSSHLRLLCKQLTRSVSVSSGQMVMWPILRHVLEHVSSISFLASGSYDSTIRLWDVNTQSAKGQPLTGHTEYVTSVAFSCDGAVLASGSWDKTIRLWDMHTHSARGGPFGVTGVLMYSLAFCHDGKTLASGALDGLVYLWDLSTFF
ncbi:WD40 repeat-like protein, partial [Clavulina sp. PMI_390]